MESVYLGLFQKVFNWVLERILDPVYRFVSGLLTTVFGWIFQEILAPVLLPVLETAMDIFIQLWLRIYSIHLYTLFAGLLKLIDYLETAFDVFIGLRDVTYTDPNGNIITGSLVEVLMQQKTVSTVFWVITLGALGLALVLTIYATARSAFDLDFENKRPVSKVLTAMMKTFINFFTVPFFVYFMLKLSGIILKGVIEVLTKGGGTSLGRIVFMIASLKAAKNPDYNLGSAASLKIELGTSKADIVRYPFYILKGENGVVVKDYGNIVDVMESFELPSFDYIVGFIAAVFLLFTIGVCLIIFVQRIFELILLYLVSPYFVCMMPLDDGEKFSRWRDMFIGKCFTGFGSAIGMRMFLMICPMVMGNRIKFGVNSSPEMDYMMKLFFLAGGAWAVFKSGSMITSLVSSSAGSSEASTASMAGGMLFAHTVGTVMSKGQQAIRTGLSGRGGGASGKSLSEAGRYKGAAGGQEKKLSLGKRAKLFAKSGKEAGYNLEKGIKGIGQAARDLKAGDARGALRTAGHMVRSVDSIRNARRAAMGKKLTPGLEERFRNKAEGLSQLAGNVLDTADSMEKAGKSIGAAAKLLVGPGKLSQKTGQLADTAKNVYRAKRQFDKLSVRYDSYKRGTGNQGSQMVDAGGSQLKVNERGQVIARKFLGTMFEEQPGPQAPGAAPQDTASAADTSGAADAVSGGTVKAAGDKSGPSVGAVESGGDSLGVAAGKSTASIRGMRHTISAGTPVGENRLPVASIRLRHTISAGTTGGAGALRSAVAAGRIRYGESSGIFGPVTRHTISAGTTGGAGAPMGAAEAEKMRYSQASRSSAGITRHTISAGTTDAAGTFQGSAGSLQGRGTESGDGGRFNSSPPVSVKTVDCGELPRARRASCSSAGEKVSYSDLSIRGLRYNSGPQGRGQITRRNSR